MTWPVNAIVILLVIALPVCSMIAYIHGVDSERERCRRPHT